LPAAVRIILRGSPWLLKIFRAPRCACSIQAAHPELISIEDFLLLTFHKIMTGCEAGELEAWRAFLKDYTPIVLQLSRIHLPACPDPVQLWQQALGEICAEGFKVLRSFGHQSEREFLVDLRAFLFMKGSSSLGEAKDSIDLGNLTVENLKELVKGLPLLHQEALFLKLSGYSDRTLEQMLRVTPEVIQKGWERLKTNYSSALNREEDACMCPAAWLAIFHELRAARTEACPHVRQFIRILDGQVGWYDKEPVEKHLVECLHCLEAWTALKELSYWRRTARPVSEAEVDQLFSGLPVQKTAEKPKSLLKKIFGSHSA
jgi:hypothetical protein